jgi:N-alpha-acetyl-L-2,4-diaminobutyrate deacetylase
MMLLEIDAVGMYDTTAEQMGKILVSTELGGGGSSTARSNAIAKRGIRNVLIHAGILDGNIDRHQSILLDMPSADCFLFSEHDGLFEILIDLEESVTKGQAIAKIWPADRTGCDPVLYRSTMDGMLVARHFPGLIKTGDCLAVVAVASPPE